MKTILAIDLGKHQSVFCKLDTSSLKPQYSTVKTDPEMLHDIFADLDDDHSIVLFEVGSQAGWLADLLRAMSLKFKVANVAIDLLRGKNCWSQKPLKKIEQMALPLDQTGKQLDEIGAKEKQVQLLRMIEAL